MRNRCASHEEIDRYPSRRKDPRRSISAAASELAFHHPGRPFELNEIGLKPHVGCVAQVLGAKLVQGRSQRAHPRMVIEHAFGWK